MNTFFPDAIASWSIFMEIFNYKDVPSIGIFKKDIISLIHPDLKSHDPAGIRYLFQLRVSLSHWYPFWYLSLQPKGIEDTRHFLLLCHAIQRIKLVISVNEIFTQN